MAEDRHQNALPNGYQFEGYRVEGVLGAGSFGVTYKARELAIDRLVAIKEYMPAGIAHRNPDDSSVRPISSADAEEFEWGLDRFQKEAATLVSFRHPNIVPVFRYFVANGTAYMVMEYQQGQSLAETSDRRPKKLKRSRDLRRDRPFAGGPGARSRSRLPAPGYQARQHIHPRRRLAGAYRFRRRSTGDRRAQPEPDPYLYPRLRAARAVRDQRTSGALDRYLRARRGHVSLGHRRNRQWTRRPAYRPRRAAIPTR